MLLLKISPFLAAAVLASAQISAMPITPSWESLLDKWGIALVLAFVAWLLWKRDDKRSSDNLQLQRELLEQGAETNRQLGRLSDKLSSPERDGNTERRNEP